MKKQIIILFILIVHLSTWSQKTIKTTTTCTDEVLFKTPGRWIKGTNVWQTDHIGFNKVQQQEVLNRMDAVHQPRADVGKLIEEKFPFDKLQAMIDK